jgi:hypothetical protein
VFWTTPGNTERGLHVTADEAQILRELALEPWSLPWSELVDQRASEVTVMVSAVAAPSVRSTRWRSPAERDRHSVEPEPSSEAPTV